MRSGRTSGLRAIVGMHAAGKHGVDPDAITRFLGGQAAGECGDGTFDGPVVGCVVAAEPADQAAQADDRPVGPAQVRERGLRGHDVAEQVARAASDRSSGMTSSIDRLPG